jgi:ADP-heptose:LPS heptosyltransferase
MNMDRLYLNPKTWTTKLRTQMAELLVRRSTARRAKHGDPDQYIRQLAASPGARIVVVVRDHLGGIMNAIPVLRALRLQFPQSRITVLTNSYALPALSGCPYIDQALGFYKFDGESQPTRFQQLQSLLQKAGTIMRLWGKVDLALHLRYVGADMLLVQELLGAKAQVGYEQGSYCDLLTVNIGWYETGKTVREWNLAVLRPLRLEHAAQDLETWITRQDDEAVDNLLRHLNAVGRRRFVCFHPGAHWGCNEWLAERWAELGDELYARHGLRVVITGTSHDEELAIAIANRMANKPIILAGKTTLAQLAAVYRRSAVVIGIDSLPRQMCQALKQRCVILFGAGDPSWFKPLPTEPMITLNKYKRIIHVNMSPPMCETWKGSCHNPACDIRPLRIIQVNDVLDAVEQLWKPATQPAVPGSPAGVRRAHPPLAGMRGLTVS